MDRRNERILVLRDSQRIEIITSLRNEMAEYSLLLYMDIENRIFDDVESEVEWALPTVDAELEDWAETG